MKVINSKGKKTKGKKKVCEYCGSRDPQHISQRGETWIKPKKSKKKINVKNGITFKATIVGYKSKKLNWDTNIMDIKKLLEGGNYKIEFIMPIGIEPTIIIKPI